MKINYEVIVRNYLSKISYSEVTYKFAENEEFLAMGVYNAFKKREGSSVLLRKIETHEVVTVLEDHNYFSEPEEKGE